MLEYYNYVKSLHLIFVITWFAGLFYIPRLFIYQIEAYDKPLPDRDILTQQFKIMTKRLWYIITWPSAILATGFAIWLLVLMPGWIQAPWMHVKLGFVILLILYHLKCHHIVKQLQLDIVKWSSTHMRLWNEGSTLILFSVVFLVIVKDAFNWIYGVIGIFLLALILMLGIKIYKKIRERNSEL
ncbi:CopD family protein [Aquimarina sp. W85]|uniref:CopD family protein n=1 Tax=Aquimarina rhodophyticola TaxID=3342246 RepID=UPI003671DB00